MKDVNKDTKRRVSTLKKNYQFQKVYRQGKSLAAPKTVLFFRRNNEVENRLGISVSKKVGKSVVRHRVKRIYSEAFNLLNSRIKNEGYDFVVVARKSAGSITFKEAVSELHKLLSRGKLLK